MNPANLPLEGIESPVHDCSLATFSQHGLLIFDVEGLHSLLTLWQHCCLPCRPSTIPCAMLARAKREQLGIERFQEFPNIAESCWYGSCLFFHLLSTFPPFRYGCLYRFVPVHHSTSLISPGFALRDVQAAVLLARCCCLAARPWTFPVGVALFIIQLLDWDVP